MSKNSNKPTLKEKYRMLREAGYNSKEAQLLRNRSLDHVNKLIKEKTRTVSKTHKQEKAKSVYKQLREKGLSTKDAQRLRYASDDTIREILRTGKVPEKGQRKRRQAVRSGGMSLVMLWKDKTDFIDDTTLQNVKESSKRESIDYLIQSINGYRQYNGGEIGDTKLEISSNPQQIIRYYSGEYYPIYVGNGTNYQKLLVAVNAMMAGIYYPFEKELFLFELAGLLNEINPKTARRFVSDMQLY